MDELYQRVLWLPMWVSLGYASVYRLTVTNPACVVITVIIGIALTPTGRRVGTTRLPQVLLAGKELPAQLGTVKIRITKGRPNTRVTLCCMLDQTKAAFPEVEVFIA